MEINQNLILKLSRPHFLSSFFSCQFRTLHDVADSSITITKTSSCSDAEGRKCPPVTNAICSSSNNARLLSSSSDTDTSFSLSSNSIHIKTSPRFNNRSHEIITKPVDDGKEIINTVVTKKCGKKCQEKSLPHYDDNDSKTARNRRIKTRIKSSGSGFTKAGCSSLIKENRAVEKRSRNPRSDFRASTVEMILEKQIFGARDLESLLLCFLSLNKVAYHEMIFEVFSEICETLNH